MTYYKTKDEPFELERIEIRNEEPPMLPAIRDAGMNPDLERTIFTYKNIIYDPSKKGIPDYLVEHEKIHMLQQMEIGADTWWEKYIKDVDFRLEEELTAYAHQYDYICQNIKDRNEKHKLLYRIAQVLSGYTYGQTITHAEAMKRIKAKSQTHKNGRK